MSHKKKLELDIQVTFITDCSINSNQNTDKSKHKADVKHLH